MTETAVRVSRGWLALREAADAAARAAAPADVLNRHAPRDGWVIHDLACGTGSMGRWLAPRLTGPQHWVLHDRDPDLLEVAAADLPAGDAITVETRRSDITALEPGDLAGASLITASALLDILTGGELDGLAGRVAAAGCPALFALSVTGNVTLDPADPLDAAMADAFNDHQRRATSRGRLMGPGAPEAIATALRAAGWEVLVRPSPWRLGPADAALTAEWLTGWVDAAREQRPELDPAAGGYAERRLAQAAAGGLAVTVGHADVLALPPAWGTSG